MIGNLQLSIEKAQPYDKAWDWQSNQWLRDRKYGLVVQSVFRSLLSAFENAMQNKSITTMDALKNNSRTHRDFITLV